MRGVRPIYTLGHLAHMSAVPEGYLEGIVNRQIDPYRLVELRKGDGRTTRMIAVPEPRLMQVQRWMLSEVFGRMQAHPAAFGYVKGRSAVLSAQAHLGAKWLVKLDVRNFFHQFDERQIYWLLRRHSYSRIVALELARISTRHVTTQQTWLPSKYSDDERPVRTRAWDLVEVAEFLFSEDDDSDGDPVEEPNGDGLPFDFGTRLGYVPQGAPSSGAITNALSFRLDERLSKLSAESCVVYTRYADDITFSGWRAFSRPEADRLLRAANAILMQEKLEPNRAKTKVLSGRSPLEVLGIRVDGEEIRLGRKTRASLDYHVRGVERFGFIAHAEHAGFRDVLGFRAYLFGLVRYAFSVEPKRAGAYEARLKAAENSLGD